MKTVHHFKTARDRLLHIETEGAIINIRGGLMEVGTYRNVTSIEILPDLSGDGCDNLPWKIANEPEAKALNIRLIQNG